ncbi:MAG: hypothetical protein GY761_09085, partial [Hyphomicrobiales bacterium]|nr:hypothetical protein [Hyphomicrobiales bacterium]
MITCPKCATNYNLDARATDGGQLQCTRCKHQWRLSDKTGSTVKPVEKTVRRIVLRPARKPDASPTAGETTLT